MSKKTTPNGILGPKALEMVMKDVLGGMEEFAVMKAYEVSGEHYKVIAIRPQNMWSVNDSMYDFDDEFESESNTIQQTKVLADVIQFSDYKKKSIDNEDDQ